MKKADSAAAAAEPVITLRDYCTGLSEVSKRVEMVSAFYTTEEKAGRTTGTRPEFVRRYQAFTHAPATAGSQRRGIS
ncbi:hypothetical protein [Nevskia sp.]|uniref:hypothetical protein n=1 Tax=Nevskia sp. TaxID=1929292 RepID=UPI0025F87866|nr:hypothetical protein [Nevskia sp.]